MPLAKTPRLKINAKTRLKADVRARSRMLLELYQPNSPDNKRRSIQQASRAGFLSRLNPILIDQTVRRNVFPAVKEVFFGGQGLKENLKEAKKELTTNKFSGAYHPASRRTFYPKVDAGKTYSKQRRYFRSVITHEMVHSLGLSKNHRVSANAIQAYLRNLKQGTHKNYRPSKLLDEPKTLRAIESSFSGWRKYLPVEHIKIAGFVPSEIGARLGNLCADIERRLKLPGLGGVILREISNGHPIRQVIKNAEEGKYDIEARTWVERVGKISPVTKKYYFWQKY